MTWIILFSENFRMRWLCTLLWITRKKKKNGWKVLVFPLKTLENHQFFVSLCNGHFVKLLAVWKPKFLAQLFALCFVPVTCVPWVNGRIALWCVIIMSFARKVWAFFLRCLHKTSKKSFFVSQCAAPWAQYVWLSFYGRCFCGRMEQYSPKNSVCHTSITVLWVIWAAYRVQNYTWCCHCDDWENCLVFRCDAEQRPYGMNLLRSNIYLRAIDNLRQTQIGSFSFLAFEFVPTILFKLAENIRNEIEMKWLVNRHYYISVARFIFRQTQIIAHKTAIAFISWKWAEFLSLGQ